MKKWYNYYLQVKWHSYILESLRIQLENCSTQFSNTYPYKFHIQKSIALLDIKRLIWRYSGRLLFFFFWPVPSSLTRDQTHPACSESTESSPLDHQGSPRGLIFWPSNSSSGNLSYQHTCVYIHSFILQLLLNAYLFHIRYLSECQECK